MDFFKKQAQSFLSEETSKPKKEESSATAPAAAAAGDEPKKKTDSAPGDVPSYSELMGSANVLLGAAKQQMGGGAGGDKAEGGKPMDTAKLADAAEDVLQAASHYGKLEGTPYGEYVKKAEGYLETYKSRDVDVTPEKKEAAAGELKAAAQDLKDNTEVPDKAVDAVQEKVEEVADPAPAAPEGKKE